MAADKGEATRRAWLAVMDRYKRNFERPENDRFWCPALETASRDEIATIQNAKLKVLTPFLYENSRFYRARFDRLGLIPSDVATVDDLVKWPVVDKAEMAADAAAHPPYGTYTTIDDAVWNRRGWMMFSSSGSTGQPRVFRYSQYDRALWEWTDARGLWAMGIRPSDTILFASGYGPHVWAWGNQFAAARAGIAVIPGGGMDARMRARLIDRYRPTVLACTPSYALRLGRVMADLGVDPAASSIGVLLVAGEPCTGIPHSRERLEDLWAARIVENYGCTEAAPNVGGFTCTAHSGAGRPIAVHLFEDVQIWETVDPETKLPVRNGARGLTVCTNLCSESSPQLRFLVGDFATFEDSPCDCGISHVRAVGGFTARADDLINLRGINLYPAQIEAVLGSVPDIGDEHEIVVATNDDGMDVMTVRVEHPAHGHPADLATRLEQDLRAAVEVRIGVEVLAPDTLPKTEFKARRVRDLRDRGGE